MHRLRLTLLSIGLLFPFARTAAAPATMTCPPEDIYTFRSGHMTNAGTLKQQVEGNIVGIGKQGIGLTVTTMHIKGREARRIHFVRADTHCIQDIIIANSLGSSYQFNVTSDQKHYHKMWQKLHQLLRDPWGEHLSLYPY